MTSSTALLSLSLRASCDQGHHMDVAKLVHHQIQTDNVAIAAHVSIRAG
jgi:hypothetical protein